MKSDKEFIEGIYLKASRYEASNTKKKKKNTILIKGIPVFSLAACAILCVLLIVNDKNDNLTTKKDNAQDKISMSRNKQFAPGDIYDITGEITDIVSYDDLRQIMCVKLADKSEIASEYIDIMIYKSGCSFKKGDIMNESVMVIQVDDKEYYSIYEASQNTN